jgi:DNA modification methylase
MKLETIDINKINPAVYNPRKDLKPGDSEYEKLKKSITEFDLVEPLILNKRGNVLIGGHQRLKVLKEMGRTEVEVSVVDLPPAKEKALNIALNKISGSWLLPELKDILQEIDTGEFDIEITGFDEKEIEDLINQLHQPEDGLTDDDEVPEPQESICKPGDLWVLGEHRLLCGDATVVTDVERLMAGEKADMVFTDPPYGIKRDKGFEGFGGFGKPIARRRYEDNNWDSKPPEKDTFDLILLQAPAALIFGGNFLSDRLPLNGHWLVWDKLNTMPTFGDCELVWTNIKRSSVKKYVFEYNGLIGKEKERYHPTQKPIGLLTAILTDYKGNIILDTFGGSGSTLIACEKLNRKCRMMEIDTGYTSVIIERWTAFTGKDAIREDGKTWSELKREAQMDGRLPVTTNHTTRKTKNV